MPLTRDFKETVQVRAARDPAFREGLLKEGVECLLAGEVDTGKIVLRDYINATIGFEELGCLTNKPPKSLMRMFGPSGNPHARNLFEVISCIQRHEGVRLDVEGRSTGGRGRLNQLNDEIRTGRRRATRGNGNCNTFVREGTRRGAKNDGDSGD